MLYGNASLIDEILDFFLLINSTKVDITPGEADKSYNFTNNDSCVF